MKLRRSFFCIILSVSTYAVPWIGLSVTNEIASAQDTAEILKWTDLSGSRTIEAKFVRLEGDNVVLERADGKEISVALNKLNLKSQAQAKRLANPQAFEKKPSPSSPMKSKSDASDNKTGDVTVTTSKSDSTGNSSDASQVRLPAGLSAADSLKRIVEELQKDNYAILMDTASPEQLELLGTMTKTVSSKLNKSSFDSIKNLFKRSGKVMAEKKEFIMNYPRLPSQVKPRLSAHYDTVVAIMNDIVASPIAEYKIWTEGDVAKIFPVSTRLVDIYGAKIAETEKALDPNSQLAFGNFLTVWGAAVSKADLISGKVRISSEQGDQATLEFPTPSGPVGTVNLQRVEGRWLGEETEAIRKAIEDQKQQLAQLEKVDEKQVSGQLTLGLAVVGGLMGQLERANSQEEFNMQMDQLLQSAGGLMGGPAGAPGLAPFGN